MKRFLFASKYLALLIAVMLLGCAKPSYQTQKSALIVIKTPHLKYADMGFVYQGKESSRVEIYANAQPLFVLSIYPNSICMDKLKCLEPSSFNEQFLSSHYPKNILSNIFNQKPIFDAQNLTQTPNGFKQRIKTQNVDIAYSAIDDRTIFRDSSNGVMIKISGQ